MCGDLPLQVTHTPFTQKGGEEEAGRRGGEERGEEERVGEWSER